MLTCSNLYKSYGKKNVVSDLSFCINKGEVFALLGSNGAGKTTTIKMILGLTIHDKGEIQINKAIRIGYSPETPYFHPFLSGLEVMEFFARLQGINKEKIYEHVIDILNKVGLLNAKDEKVKNYSKGMVQRLAIAQSLIGSPELLILDEPTSGLDAVGRLKILELIKELKKLDKTIILNSHILSDVERVADRGIILDRGRMVKSWDISECVNGESLEKIFIDVIGRDINAYYNA